MTLDELKNLDPKDAGNWPIPVQLGAMALLAALVIGIGHYYVWQPQLDELEVGRQKEEQLKQDFLEKKKRAINLEAYRQQLLEIQQSFGALLKQLPNKSEMETLLTEINQAGVGRGLLFELFKPGVELKTAEFAEMPISIKVTGSYHDLAAFVSDVAQLSRIVTLSDIKLSVPKDPSMLTMEATIKTYRALDDAELQAIRQAELEARKKKRQ
ncbi:type 4a pilus biogenesis protein PilO [Chitinibacter bivalviorum]|uniref:Type 4a pilus biogenesis protein PilO n=1 Tax=Chitinibacter bivalviorum TaxID=2739434 RepID=A0A7H9BM04_9NEIS|nr:type 4a pilus biogenesis protein PilO [Chitinibacter bivalviorum]QLG89720.1 type 4a pilus biogenesis protein PilO [Chitinibacter bivalviorum]